VNDEYGVAREDELPELASILSWCFGFPSADAAPWLAIGGLENVRVLRRDRKIAACLLLIDQAQFFGGKSVPAIGIAGVGTPPESRGAGAAIVLMESMLRELASRGIATSSLYPATIPLYRRVGYELAGTHHEITVPITAIECRDRTLPLRLMTSDDDDAVKACYRAHATRTNGHVDRGPYIWKRVHAPRGEVTRGFVVGQGTNVDGYAVVYEKRPPGSLNYSLVATDLVAHTAAATRRLLTFLADHGTLAESITWKGSPNDTFVHALTTLRTTSRLYHHWMTRIVDVPAALTARGYASILRGELALEIADDVIASNAGAFVLRVEDGHAEVKRGGSGGLRLHVRALAAMLTSHMTPYALAASGHLEGTNDQLAIASALFAGAPPWMPDFF
jgi:predicted acetyltransferase